MEFKQIKNLTVAQDGAVYFQLREVFPDKTGIFASKTTTAGGTTSISVTTEEILEAWNNDPSVAKALDKQIKHSNLSFEQLTKWKLANDDKKTETRKSGKSELQIQRMTF